jgi:hypothetical protein
VGAFPLRLAAASAALRDAGAHGRDRSTLADRRAATVAALTAADLLNGAETAGDPKRVPGLRGGSALVTRRGPGLTLTLSGVRFVRDVGIDGFVTHDTSTGSVYGVLTLRAADGSARTLVVTWSTRQPAGYASARGSADGRPLLLVLRAP